MIMPGLYRPRPAKRGSGYPDTDTLKTIHDSQWSIWSCEPDKEFQWRIDHQRFRTDKCYRSIHEFFTR